VSRRSVRIASALILCLPLTIGSTAAAASENVQVRLRSAVDAVSAGAPFTVLIHFQIRPGWHIYWKNPGDSGLPPRVTWMLPRGFQAGPIEWPVPERLLAEGLMSYGYTREATLPVRITPPATLGPDSVRIAGALEWLECKEACLAGSSALRLSLPVSPQLVKGDSDVTARSRLPVSPDGWSLSAQAGSRAIALDFTPPRGITPKGAYFFVDQPLVTEHAAPQRFQRTRTGYRLTLEPAANASGNLARLSGVLEIEGSGRMKSGSAIQVDVPVVPGDPAPAPAPSTPREWPVAATALALAFAVGLLIFVRRRSASTRT